jgi:site-specific recombinase XerD
MLFTDARDQFIAHCRSAMNLSSHTLRAYESDLKNAETYWNHHRHLSQVEKNDLRNYIRHQREERKSKESSIKRRIASLKLLFKWAQHEAMVESNPFDGLQEKIRLPKRLPRALDREDSRRLMFAVRAIKRIDNLDMSCQKIAIHLLLETGIRVSELTSIRLEDVSLSDRSIKIHGKGNRQRLAYFLSSELVLSMQAYLQKRKKSGTDQSGLLITRDGSIVTPPKIRSWLKAISSEAGITRHVTPHMLRHTCATQWLESGLDIRYVQKLLGHHSISTTEIYTHVSDQGLREALLKMNGGRSIR